MSKKFNASPLPLRTLLPLSALLLALIWGVFTGSYANEAYASQGGSSFVIIEEDASSEEIDAVTNSEEQAVSHLELTVMGDDPAKLNLAPEDLPVLGSQSAVVVYGRGTPVYDFRGGVVRPMASTTKVMTAYTFLQSETPMDATIAIPAEVAHMDYATMGYAEGQVVSAQELFDALLIVSGNDAANALGILSYGNVSLFVDHMNLNAQTMGLKDTAFKNPSGLEDAGHHSTARDLIDLSIISLYDPRIARTVKKASLSVTNADGTTKVIPASNKLLGVYPGMDGVKTGFTDEAGNCLISRATRDGMTVYACVLGAPDRAVQYGDTETLLNWAFSHCPITDLSYLVPTKKRISLGLNSGLEVEVELVGDSTYRTFEWGEGPRAQYELLPAGHVEFDGMNKAQGTVLWTQDEHVLGAGTYAVISKAQPALSLTLSGHCVDLSGS